MLRVEPEYHFSDLIFAHGYVTFFQEFTQSDTTTYQHEIEVSDTRLELDTTGYTESHTGLNLSGGIRFTVPTSKLSQFKTTILGIGPGLSLSRKFDLLSGLTLSYGARWTGRFARSQTMQAGVARYQSCRSTDCLDTGSRNSPWDITHGPSIEFKPHERLSLSFYALFVHAKLYDLAPAQVEFNGAQGLNQPDFGWRNAALSVLALDYQLFKPVTLELGSFTLTPELIGKDGQYVFPLFNRYTTLYLEASFDIEAMVSSFI
jgi:hypothetical protein